MNFTFGSIIIATMVLVLAERGRWWWRGWKVVERGGEVMEMGRWW